MDILVFVGMYVFGLSPGFLEVYFGRPGSI